MKPFCTARQGLAATQAFIDLLDGGLDPRSIERISVFTPPAYAGMIAQGVNPASRTSGFVSVGFQMGLAACHRAHLWDLDRASVMNDPQVLDLVRRVTVEPDSALAADFPRRWPARIEVHAAGQVETRTLLIAPGDPEAPLDDEAFARKAHRILDPLFGAPQADELLWLAGEGLTNDLALARLAAAFTSALQP
jgi:2-methylcitrate dehydratase PrpD